MKNKHAPKLMLLNRIISKRSPDEMTIVNQLGTVSLNDGQREKLRGVLADELIEFGLLKDDEPNEYGLLIEDLVDLLRLY